MKQVVLSDPVQPGDRIPLTGASFHHLRTVRRVEPGELLTVLSGTERYSATVERVDTRKIILRIGELRAGPSAGSRSVRPLHVYFGALKGNRSDALVRGLTEIGVASIGIIHTERCIARVSADHWGRRLSRLKTIVREAVEQCGRDSLPELHPPQELRELAQSVKGGIVFHESGYPRDLAPLVSGDSGDGVSLLVGPEGGFSQKELDLLAGEMWVPVTLPLPVLRAETAVLTVSALVSVMMNRYSIDS